MKYILAMLVEFEIRLANVAFSFLICTNMWTCIHADVDAAEISQYATVKSEGGTKIAKQPQLQITKY